MKEMFSMKKNNEEIKKKIYVVTLKLIQTYGIKGWTMDLLCEEVNLAKDTLYRIIKSKDNLISEVIKVLIESHEKDVTEILTSNKEFFEIFTLLCKRLGGLLNKLGTPQIRSLFREYPDTENIINQYASQLDMNISEYLKQGINLGLINPDTDTLLVAKSAKHTIVALLSDDSIDNPNDAITKYLQYIVYGIRRL